MDRERNFLEFIIRLDRLNLWNLKVDDVARTIQEYLGARSFLIKKKEENLKKIVKNFIHFPFKMRGENYHLYFECPQDFSISPVEYEKIRYLLNIIAKGCDSQDLTRARIIESQIINELNLNVLTTLDERKIIWYIESGARKLLNNEEIYLYYLVDDKLIGRNNEFSIKIMPKELYQQLFKNRQFSFVKNPEDKFLKSIIKSTRFNEAIFVPFSIKNECRGFFMALNGKKVVDSKYAITRLKFLGNQSAIALERIELIEALNCALKESQGLQEIARILLTPFELRSIFNEILRRAQKLLGFRKILCSIFNPTTASFDRIIAVGVSKKKMDEARKVHPPLNVIKKLFQDRYRISNSYYLPAESVPPDIRQYELYKTRKTKTRIERLWNSGDILITPIYSRNGELLAFLSLDEPYDNLAPDFARIRLLEAFGDFLGLAIENHNLFRRIERLSYTDELTGVYNYRFLREKLSELIERNISPIVVVMVDLDGFKEYNDHYGHLAGDEVLKKISLLLKEVIKKDGYVIRYGGDEFIVLLPQLGLRAAQNRIVKLYNAIFGSERKTTEIRFSAGFAIYPEDGRTFGELIDCADKRLYFKKRKGYGTTQK